MLEVGRQSRSSSHRGLAPRAQVTDQNGKTLTIEQIAASGAPTLIFIAYDGPGGLANRDELVSQFERRGVAARN